MAKKSCNYAQVDLSFGKRYRVAPKDDEDDGGRIRVHFYRSGRLEKDDLLARESRDMLHHLLDKAIDYVADWQDKFA